MCTAEFLCVKEQNGLSSGTITLISGAILGFCFAFAVGLYFGIWKLAKSSPENPPTELESKDSPTGVSSSSTFPAGFSHPAFSDSGAEITQSEIPNGV